MTKPIENFHSPEHEFLSNFYPAWVELDGVVYPTLEHAYQAAKTLNKFERQTIYQARTAGKAKRLGNLISVRPDWDSVKMQIMCDLIAQKFSEQNPELVKRLLATGDAVLIEGNHWGDTYWGVCNGFGTNWLGHILMDRRTELQWRDTQ